jgi:hypothetical protein
VAKKLSLLLAAVAVLAFAVPAFASASTGLTESGSLVAVGTEVLGTNNGVITTTSSKTGNINCEEVKVYGKILANSAAEVRANNTGTANTSFATKCSNTNGATVEVSEIKLNELKTTGGGVGTASISFKIKLGSLTCSYTTTTGSGTYVPGASPAEITISEQALSVTPIACGTTAKLDGKFKLSTVGGTALVLD